MIHYFKQGVLLTKEQAKHVREMMDVLQNNTGLLLDIKLGILYDTWHEKFNEDIPYYVEEMYNLMRGK